jgi:hypothetical protein
MIPEEYRTLDGIGGNVSMAEIELDYLFWQAVHVLSTVGR